jgi:hypothetical protein
MNLAPNGKPSNLTPEQYRLVRTPAFKKWFGDWENSPETASKVLDKNGEPKIMWHGTNIEDITEFNPTKGDGFNFFATDKYESMRYGKIIKQYFLNARRIIDFMNLNENQSNDVEEILTENSEYFINRIDKGDMQYYKEDLFEDGIEDLALLMYHIKSDDNYYFIEDSIFQNYIKSKGYDAFITSESQYGNIAIYDNKNIKLADGSNTTFDSSNDDIRFEDGGLIDDIFVEDMYSVVIDGDSYHDIIYDGKDYDYALYRYNSIEPDDFLYPNGSHNHKLLMKYFIKYKFVGEVEDGNKISDYIDYLNDSDYWEVIEKSEWEELISDDVAAVNKSTDEIISEIRDFINSKYVHLRYGSKYMNIYVYNDEDEDDEIDYITIRVADHSQNPRNRTHEHHISFVIANKNETKDRFRSRDEYYYDDDDDIEYIKSEIESIIDEKIEEIKQERYEKGGNTQKIVGLNYKDGEEDIYSDEYVNGVIRIVDSDVEILDWNSKYKKIGGTEISLQRLKNAYKGEIRAVDVGYEGENSYSYWQKMMSKSLIDGFYDDDANYISKYEQGGVLNNLFIYNIGGL